MVEPPMTVSTTATIPTDVAFEVLARRHHRTVRRQLVDSDGIPTVDQLTDTMPTHQHAGSNPEDVHVQLHHSHRPRLTQPRRMDYDSPRDAGPYPGNELVDNRPRRSW